MSIDKKELLKMGARSRLVELETERVELLKLFPDLDQSETVSVVSAAKKRKPMLRAKPKAQKKNSHTKEKTTRLDVVAALAKSLDQVTPADVAKKLSMRNDHAASLLGVATKRGIVERVERGVYRRAS